MLPTPEQVLQQRIIQQNEGLGSPEAAGTMGAALGAGAGVLMGSVPHALGNGINKLVGREAKGIGRALKPGHRMAGGLVGLILGGGLGMAARNEMIGGSPEARLMAKLQVQGSLEPVEEQQLQSMIQDTYSRMGSA